MAIKVGDKVRVVLRSPPPLAWASSQAGKVGTVVAVLPEPGLNVHVAFPDEHVVWYFADTELRPPDEKHGPNPICCPECSNRSITGPDEEGLYDCNACGIWFDPKHPNNKKALEKQVQLRYLPFICARFPGVEHGRIEEMFDTRDEALARFAEIEADVEDAAIYYAVGGVETLKDR